MKTNQSNPQRYIEIDGQQIAVSEEVYLAYYRPIWAENKRYQRQKRCMGAYGHRCTDDCATCGQQRSGTPVSLESIEDAGHAYSETAPDSAEIVERNFVHQAVRKAVDELEPQNRQIIQKLFFENMTERQTAAAVGLSQGTVNNRKNRILATLGEQLKDFR